MPFICDCSFPIPSSIESEACTVEAAGVGSPVNTFPVTAEFVKVTAPEIFDVPSTLLKVPVASPLIDKSLAVCHAVAVSAFPVTFPCKSLCTVEGKLKVVV